MKARWLLGIAFLAVGCSAGVTTEADTQRVLNEMSHESYEEAMRRAGRGAELEAEKERDARYTRARSR